MREAMAIADEIIAERRRQIEAEGFNVEEDDRHSDGSLADAAACYVKRAAKFSSVGANAVTTKMIDLHTAPKEWPWHSSWWKPKNVRRDLIRAAALIVAEIERLDREAAAQEGDGFNPLGSGPDAITPRDILNISAAQAANALEDF